VLIPASALAAWGQTCCQCVRRVASRFDAVRCDALRCDAVAGADAVADADAVLLLSVLLMVLLLVLGLLSQRVQGLGLREQRNAR
jgi:hypothetical protein